MSRIIAVTSGKGGVGKTHLSVNLALQCARVGLRTCVFDADLGLANANLPRKLTPRLTLADVLDGRCHLQDIVQKGFGFDIIPGCSGVERVADLPHATLRRLGGEFRALGHYDLIVLDTASGVAGNLLALVAAAPEVLLVITPEPTVLTDAYALVKLLLRRQYQGRIQVVVNQAQSERQALHTYEKFREVVRVYQGIDLPFLGAIPEDARVAEAAGLLTPISILQPESGAGLALAELATRLLHTSAVVSEQNALDAFWERLTGQELGSLPESVAAVRDAAPVPTPESTQPAASADVPADITLRLEHLESRLAQITALLELHTLAQSARQTEAAPETATPPRESAGRAAPGADVQPLQHRRRAGETPQAGRGLRTTQRATPIDALQLRRVVGRMLVKAMPGAAPDAATGVEPVQIAVDQLQLEGGNEFSLRPGRYTRISLYCTHIQSPDQFIEEIFANCAITGCKVRHLGSHVRYWVTSGRDGCILLDGAVGERNCVQVYMAAGGNSPLEAVGSELEAAIPKLRRVSRDGEQGAATPALLLGKFPHERLEQSESEDGLTLYRLSRRDREPLLCAFHHADAEEASGALRERSP